MFKLIKKLFSRNKPNFNNSTRQVKTPNGKDIELYNDWPDEMASVIEETFKTGKVFTGKIVDGKVIKDKDPKE